MNNLGGILCHYLFDHFLRGAVFTLFSLALFSVVLSRSPVPSLLLTAGDVGHAGAEVSDQVPH